MDEQKPYFLKPSTIERIFNRFMGVLTRLGVGPAGNFTLEVRGRKSGKTFSTPVTILDYQEHRYLVAPRGETNWVRNARAAAEVTLARGSRRDRYAVREVAAADRPPLLKEYLDRNATVVQRYFPVKKGSPESAFAEIAERYPVFELILRS